MLWLIEEDKGSKVMMRRQVLIISLLLLSCNNPSAYLGLNKLEVIRLTQNYFYEQQIDGDKDYYHFAYKSWNNVVVLQLSPITEEVESYYFTSFVSFDKMKNYLGSNFDVIVNNFGKPFVVRKVNNINHKITFNSFYFQRDWNEISPYVVCCEYDEKNVIIGIKEVYWGGR